MDYFVSRQLDFHPYFNERPSFMEHFEKREVLHDSFRKCDEVIHVLQSDWSAKILAHGTKIE